MARRTIRPVGGSILSATPQAAPPTNLAQVGGQKSLLAPTPGLTPGMKAGQAADMMPPSMGTPIGTSDPNADMMLPSTGTPIGTSDPNADMMPPSGGIPPTGAAPTATSDLVGQFQEQGELARQANIERYEQGLGIHKGIADVYAPGGAFGQGQLEQYQRRKAQDVASQRQQLISSGLGSTTVAAGLERGYEADVGVQFRTQLADIQMQRYAEAMGQQAGFIERRTDEPPSPTLMASLVTQAEAGPGGPSYTEEAPPPLIPENIPAPGEPPPVEAAPIPTAEEPTPVEVTAPVEAPPPTVPAATAPTTAPTAAAAPSTGMWGSGATGPISSRQYEDERKRQSKLAGATKQFESYTKNLDKYQAKFDETPEENPAIEKQQAKIDKYNAAVAKKLAGYEAKLTTYQGDPKKVARQQKKIDKYVADTTKKLDKYAADLAALPKEDPKRAKYQEQIDKYEEKLDSAESNIEKYADITAGISSRQFATEEQTRATRKRAAEAAEAARRRRPEKSKLVKYGSGSPWGKSAFDL